MNITPDRHLFTPQEPEVRYVADPDGLDGDVDWKAACAFPNRAVVALSAILQREALRLLGQQGRLFAALVRPLVWLFVFAAGFRAALGLAITPPYQTYITYEIYITPGLVGMILLFNGMQSSLSLVYDREMGSMRLLLTAPLPRWWLLTCKLVAGSLVSVLQAYVFLAVAAAWGIRFPPGGYLAALPAITLAALMVGALGLVLSSFIRQLENFAGVMNFVIFPVFFLSSALYPLWKMAEAWPLLRDVCAVNPFTHAVELIRFALHAQLEPLALTVTIVALAVFGAGAIWGYDPARGLAARKI
ncbi:ABC-2 type transport system permease protein [Sinorhizobium kostiense]|uniref:Transport permease protein n=1 Tax=Sinorhizobium kostiense TaxID=76747 RepID=A0ABS4R5H9_9HYPH|nr:ABC transporter permease [Sinorhizobium kostiense]MBP2238128.1 ABC-2 type transport system permease protein [Sinorhizobium kostiense]